MATISENLLALQQAKTDIKTAIESKGQDLTDVPFTEYHVKIADIQTGGGGTEGVELILPEAFATATTFYYVKVDNNTLLLSADNTNIGVWEYNLTDNSCVQLYNQGIKWQYFQEVKNGWFITSYASDTSSSGLLFYNKITKTITKEITVGNGEVRMSTSLNGVILFSLYYGRAGICFYNETTNEFSTMPDTNTRGWTDFTVVGDDCVISGADTGSLGIHIYKSLDGTLTQVYATGSSWAVRIVASDNCFISSGSSSNKGLFKYNSTTKTFETLREDGYSWKYYYEIEDGCFISCAVSATPGLFLYSYSENALVTIHTTGYGWQYFYKLGNDLLISCSSSQYGLYRYNPTDRKLFQLTSSSYGWYVVITLGDISLLTGGSGGGLFAYNSADSTYKSLTTSYGGWKNVFVVRDRCLMSSNVSYSGLICYDIPTNTAKTLATSSYNWVLFGEIGDKYLFSSSNYNGLLVYDYTKNTASTKFSAGQGYDTLIEDNGTYYIEASDKTKSKYTLSYNPTNNTAKLVKYYLGEI